MKVVLDTNVLVAAFLTRGTCADLLEHCARFHELVTSAEILGELHGVLVGKFRMTRADANGASRLLRSRMEVVVPGPLGKRVSRDADDDMILATAKAAAADCIVTGDRDLLDLETYEGIRILTPSAFWKFETE